MKNILLIILIAVMMINNALAVETMANDPLIYEHYQQTKSLPTYAYPNHDLSQLLEAEGKNQLTLFSYGSLMDVNSASKTLSPKALETRRPALAFGLKRLFDRDVPITKGSHWGIPCNPQATGMLNVHNTDDVDDVVNGVLIEVPLTDIPAFLEREQGYDLIPVVTLDWQQLEQGNVKITIAYTLSAPIGSIYVGSTILPRPGYYELSRDAAKQYGSDFESLWYSSTFMGDAVSPITLWEEFIETKSSQTLVCTPA